MRSLSSFHDRLRSSGLSLCIKPIAARSRVYASSVFGFCRRTRLICCLQIAFQTFEVTSLGTHSPAISCWTSKRLFSATYDRPVVVSVSSHAKSTLPLASEKLPVRAKSIPNRSCNSFKSVWCVLRLDPDSLDMTCTSRAWLNTNCSSSVST